METKTFRITYKDWKILRQIIHGLRNETVAEYMGRVINTLAYYDSRGRK